MSPGPLAPDKGSRLLPPMLGVRLAWVMTSGFPGPAEADREKTAGAPAGPDTFSLKTNAKQAEAMLDATLKLAESRPVETPYVREAVFAVRAGVRNLSTIYSGRQLNFSENTILRDTYLDSIQIDISFGENLRDYARTLPAIVATGGTGSLAISFLISWLAGISLSPAALLFLAILFGMAGYFIHLFIRKQSTAKKREQFFWQDYERNIYFEHYLNRVTRELLQLYETLAKLQEEYLDYSEGTVAAANHKNQIQEMLRHLYPTTYTEIDLCVSRPEFDTRTWIRCETCGESTQGLHTVVQKPSDCRHRPPASSLSGVLAAICLVALVLIAYMALSTPPPYKVELTKIPGSEVIYQNQTVGILVTVGNRGTSGISNLTIVDTSPPEFQFIGGNLTRSIANLQAGESRSVQYLVRPGNAGRFILSPAHAEFIDSTNTSQRIVSNTPVLRVMAGTEQNPADLTAFNSTEFYRFLKY